MIESHLQALSVATGGDLYDHEWNGGEWMVEAVETRENIEQFIESSRNWAERSGMTSGTIGGLPFVAWKNMQPRKGAPRRSLSVIDFGDVRYAVESDLEVYL